MHHIAKTQPELVTNRAGIHREQCHLLDNTLPGFPRTPLAYHYKPLALMRQCIPGAEPVVGLYTPGKTGDINNKLKLTIHQ